jgi:hypothetical protein
MLPPVCVGVPRAIRACAVSTDNDSDFAVEWCRTKERSGGNYPKDTPPFHDCYSFTTTLWCCTLIQIKIALEPQSLTIRRALAASFSASSRR